MHEHQLENLNGSTNYQVDCGNWASGIYFIKSEVDNQVRSYRFTVAH